MTNMLSAWAANERNEKSQMFSNEKIKECFENEYIDQI